MNIGQWLPSERRRREGIDDASRRALQGFVLPIWIGAGLADWWCHHRSDIEHTADAAESAIHAAMMIEGGLPTLLGLFCEVNAGVLALTYGTLAVHELTAMWDVAYADGRREVTPTVQHVHGFLERVPLMAHRDAHGPALGSGPQRVRGSKAPPTGGSDPGGAGSAPAIAQECSARSRPLGCSLTARSSSGACARAPSGIRTLQHRGRHRHDGRSSRYTEKMSTPADSSARMPATGGSVR